MKKEDNGLLFVGAAVAAALVLALLWREHGSPPPNGGSTSEKVYTIICQGTQTRSGIAPAAEIMSYDDACQRALVAVNRGWATRVRIDPRAGPQDLVEALKACLHEGGVIYIDEVA